MPLISKSLNSAVRKSTPYGARLHPWPGLPTQSQIVAVDGLEAGIQIGVRVDAALGSQTLKRCRSDEPAHCAEPPTPVLLWWLDVGLLQPHLKAEADPHATIALRLIRAVILLCKQSDGARSAC